MGKEEKGRRKRGKGEKGYKETDKPNHNSHVPYCRERRVMKS